MKCYLCGKEIDDAARFCSFCGGDQSKRPAETVNCCHCGKPIKPTARFCAYCGGNQAEPPVVEEPVPVVVAEPEPVVVAEPEPVVVTEPEPVVAAEPEPVVAAEPEPVVAAEPEPVVAAEPEPVVAAEPEPVVAAESEPVVVAEPEPVVAAEPEPVVVAEPEPAPQPIPQPVPQPIPVVPPTPAPQRSWQQQVQQQQPAVPARPALQLPTGRSLGKMFWLGLITAGIYDMVIMSRIVEEMNITSSRYDGKRTQQLLWVLMLAPITLFIYPLVWFHGLCNRIGAELFRRALPYKFSATTFWMMNLVWPLCIAVVGGIAAGVLAYLKMGAIILIAVGAVAGICCFITPLIFVHKMMRSVNLINADYNAKG